MKRMIYIVVGCIAVGLGAIGAVVPLLPAFPFLLLAAYCFARSSEHLHTWFVQTKLYKENLADFVAGKGMRKDSKVRIMSMVSLLMGIGFIMMRNVPIGQMVLLFVWLFHMVYFIWGIKTLDA